MLGACTLRDSSSSVIYTTGYDKVQTEQVLSSYQDILRNSAEFIYLFRKIKIKVCRRCLVSVYQIITVAFNTPHKSET